MHLQLFITDSGGWGAANNLPFTSMINKDSMTIDVKMVL